jgi:hypothetical protein
VTEQQPYEVLRRGSGLELRRYPEHVVAQVTVQGTFERAGTLAFGVLFGYINGRNRSRTTVSMTAPVVQNAAGEGEHAVGFVLPAGLTEQTAPEPTDPRVQIRTVPPATVAALRYSGRWTHESYERHLRGLLAALAAEGLSPVGEPWFARFDPPFTPWFLRHNEVLVEVTGA